MITYGETHTNTDDASETTDEPVASTEPTSVAVDENGDPVLSPAEQNRLVYALAEHDGVTLTNLDGLFEAMNRARYDDEPPPIDTETER